MSFWEIWQIIFQFILIFVLLWPWLSLTWLSELKNITKELKEIKEQLKEKEDKQKK